MNTSVHFSSKTDNWSTPQWLFDQLNEEFHFTLDVCADPQNAKCVQYFTREQDGLSKEWDGTVWCNPPYGRTIGLWVKKVVEFVANGGGTCGHAAPCQNRHPVVSRLHLRESRNPFSPGKATIRKCYRKCTLPQYDRNLSRRYTQCMNVSNGSSN